MKLISATLAGPGTAAIIGDALRSAAPLIVDSRLVIWTGPAASSIGWDVFKAAHSVEGAANDLLWEDWPWPGRFDAARNASLTLAAQTGAEWMAMLDTDERILCPNPAAFHAFLDAQSPTVQVVAVMAEGGHYARERFFRLPARYRFSGRTHEAFNVASGDEQAMAPRELVQWRELPKTAEELRGKFERDLVLLAEEVAEHPQDQRWRYYQGTALQALERHEEALVAFRACIALGGGEGTAFACVRAAQSLLALGEEALAANRVEAARPRFDRAVDACAAGVARYPGIGELYGLAAVAHMRQGRVYEAEDAARVAKALGMGSGAERRRMGFRLPEYLGHVPDEVLRWVASTREAT